MRVADDETKTRPAFFRIGPAAMTSWLPDGPISATIWLFDAYCCAMTEAFDASSWLSPGTRTTFILWLRFQRWT